MRKLFLLTCAFFCAACASLPTSSEYMARADGYLKDAKPQKALAAYNRAILLNPKNLDAYAARGAAHFFAGNFALAEADFKYVLAKKPYYADAYTALGSVFASRGDYESALTMFNQAIALKPTRPENFTSRAGVYFMQGRYQEALADYSAVLQYYPAAQVYQARAAVYQQLGEVNLAQQDLAASRNASIPQTLEEYQDLK